MVYFLYGQNYDTLCLLKIWKARFVFFKHISEKAKNFCFPVIYFSLWSIRQLQKVIYSIITISFVLKHILMLCLQSSSFLFYFTKIYIRIFLSICLHFIMSVVMNAKVQENIKFIRKESLFCLVYVKYCISHKEHWKKLGITFSIYGDWDCKLYICISDTPRKLWDGNMSFYYIRLKKYYLN